MRLLFWCTVLAALAASARPLTAPEGNTKYLIVTIEIEAGWADSFRKYYDLLVLANLTNRTLVLEPFDLSGPDIHGLKDVDPDEILKAPKEEWVDLQRSKIDYQGGHQHTVPFEDWMDVPKLQETYQVITFADWLTATKGVVHTALIQAERELAVPLPEFSDVCQESGEQKPMPSDAKVDRLGQQLIFQRTVCITREELGDSLVLPDDIDAESNTAENISAWLNTRYADVPTLALDISQYWHSPFRPELHRSHGKLPHALSMDGIREAITLNPRIYAAAATFLQDTGLSAPYVCFHWRRGDVAVDLADIFLPHNVAWVMPRLQDALRKYAREYTGLVLVTDSPYEIEIERFKKAVKEQTGLPVVRHHTGDKTKDIAVDLALGAKADLMLSNYQGSFYANWMQDERKRYGLVDLEWLAEEPEQKPAPQLEMPWEDEGSPEGFPAPQLEMPWEDAGSPEEFPEPQPEENQNIPEIEEIEEVEL